MTTPMSINPSGEIAGYYQTSSNQEDGFTYAAGAYNILDVPGSAWTIALAVNAAGEVAGYYEDPSFQLGGFIDKAGTFTTFALPGQPYQGRMTFAAAGEVFGSYMDSAGNSRGYVYPGTRAGMSIMNAGYFATLNAPAAVSSFLLMGVDNAGAIFGGDGLQSFVAMPTASPVSEPAGVGLIGMAGAGLAWLRHRGSGRPRG